MHFESWGFLSKPFSFSGAKNDSLTVHYFSQPCQLLIGGNQRTVVTSLMFEQLEGTATQNKNNHRYLNQCHPKMKVCPSNHHFSGDVTVMCAFSKEKLLQPCCLFVFVGVGHPRTPHQPLTPSTWFQTVHQSMADGSLSAQSRGTKRGSTTFEGLRFW